jgi:hypothetical protein
VDRPTRLEIVPYGGWPACLRLRSAHLELVVTLSVGPRVIHLSTPGGPNVFHQYPDQLGGVGEPRWRARGGHRLWIAPESSSTYALDNARVEHRELGPGHVVLFAPPEPESGCSKSLELRLSPDAPWVEVRHRVTCEEDRDEGMAAWALSMMAPGGLAVMPQPPLGEHPRDLLPNRSLILWPYTDLTDPRLVLGRRFLSIRQEAGRPPLKIGLWQPDPWAAYAVHGLWFVKRFPIESALPSRDYPDMGANFECFTDGDMLELESLGPRFALSPGQSVKLRERWELYPGAPEGEALRRLDTRSEELPAALPRGLWDPPGYEPFWP